MKKPESKKKFIASVILMITFVIGCVLFIVGAQSNMMGVGNPWVAFAGFCIVGISTMILCSGMGELFKIFFTTIFGKDKKDNGEDK